MTARLLALPLAALALAACGSDRPPSGAAASPEAAAFSAADLPQDVHSYARPAEARVTHVALELDADFETQTLAGTATLTIDRAEGATEVVLDARDLDVAAVTDAEGAPLAFTLGESDPLMGAPLTVQLPASGDEITVAYATSPGAAAVQWLEPAQTASGQPFLFTQGQAILTRTWIPTQDSPGIRQTYEARVTVPESLTAVMSAEGNGDAGVAGASGATRTFSFELDKPIPPYLIALAIGDLEFREIGPRTGVWAEPSVVEAAQSEFAEVESMMEAAEELYGPYRWGRYDILVLPPSFPFGGMENPLLTFATPTILAGDRSLVSLVAHELAHSWSGNLVTNATWDDFWINEGFTSYFENRIMEAVYGPEYAAMLETLSRTGLDEAVGEMPEADQHLHLALEGRDPDDGMNAIAYDKGALFVRHMEVEAGRERFDAYLRGYFDRYAFQPMTDERFLADLDRHLIAGDADLRERIAPEAWIYGPGLPENAPRTASAAFARAGDQAEAFASGETPAAGLETADWSTHEWLHFLGQLPADEMSTAQLDELDAAFGLSEAGNSEIRFAWLRLAIANEYEPAVESLEAFLTSQGRRKFVLPLFRDLHESEWGRPIADRIYRAARPGYHSITYRSVDEALGV